MRLQGKVALITGAGRGIGRAIALAFTGEGADVALSARTVAELDSVAKEVEARGGRAVVLPADFADAAQAEALAARALEAFGHVDILVNNAGVAIHAPVPDIRTDVWELTMAVNLRAPFLLTRALWNHMAERGGGHILNVSSISGKQAGGGNAAYAASKFGLVGFTESLARAGTAVNIRAHAICPGGVATRQRAVNNPTEDPSRILQPEDIAEVARFLVTLPPRVLIREVVIELNPGGLGSLPEPARRPTR
jgi:3-oxoacyl-[acyl-carrier protein] reductase